MGNWLGCGLNENFGRGLTHEVKQRFAKLVTNLDEDLNAKIEQFKNTKSPQPDRVELYHEGLYKGFEYGVELGYQRCRAAISQDDAADDYIQLGRKQERKEWMDGFCFLA